MIELWASTWPEDQLDVEQFGLLGASQRPEHAPDDLFGGVGVDPALEQRELAGDAAKRTSCIALTKNSIGIALTNIGIADRRRF